MNQIECIAKELSCLKAELPEISTIGRLSFRYDITKMLKPLGKVECHISSKKRQQGHFYTVVFDESNILVSGIFFEGSPILPPRKEDCVDSEVDIDYFSKEAIISFVERVKDDNPIHRGTCPVVPGLMSLEALWAAGMSRKLFIKGLGHVKFKRPLYGNQGFRIIYKKSSIEMVNAENQQIVELILEENNE